MSRKCASCGVKWAFTDGLCRDCSRENTQLAKNAISVLPHRHKAAAAAPRPVLEPSRTAVASSAALAADGSEDDHIARLVLPCEDLEEWAFVEAVLGSPVNALIDLDAVMAKFEARCQHRSCSFFADIPGSSEASEFDFDTFFEVGLPMLLEMALAMPTLFAGVQLPIFRTGAGWSGCQILTKKSISLSRQQCACLLAHSFLGSLRLPPGVQPNDWRFTVADLFVGTARSPNSAAAFLHYFTDLGRHGFADGCVTFERRGYQRGPSPWVWESNAQPLCAVRIVDGALQDCAADVHAEFANAFIGGGVMTGDFAMEELLFLMKPELMVAMALQHRMTDTESIAISGALQYSRIRGYGASFEFAGECSRSSQPQPPPTVCAIDAVRGGGPAMAEAALLRDLNKARAAFDGAREVATGHWGCGAFGNNHDLMFLKQWLAASEAGVHTLHYHDFDRAQSHNVVPLLRKLGHLTVGELWSFLHELTADLRPANVAAFSVRMREIATGKRPPPRSDKNR